MISLILKVTFFSILFLNSVRAEIKFLSLSDIHYGSGNQSADGKDTGPEFLKITLNKIKELNKEVNFILFLGDMPTHSFLTNTHKAEEEKTVFHTLYAGDTSAKPLFYIPGNNDSLEGNYQRFESNGISPLTYATEWTGACAHCEGLIIDDSHMYHDGYYSSYVIPDNKEIMLIALNATQWTRIPWLKKMIFPKYDNQQKDALAQMAWFEEQLKNNHGKQLLIALHEPPGNSYLGEPYWYKEYLTKFINLLSKYHYLYEEISILSSHTHMEEFRKIKLDTMGNVSIYSTPSISRNHHNNPAMKIFILNDDFKITDFITYYTSELSQWGNEHYHALNASDAIFPECGNDNTLSQCLNQRSIKQICDALEIGSFYGVRNTTAKTSNCLKTYSIN